MNPCEFWAGGPGRRSRCARNGRHLAASWLLGILGACGVWGWIASPAVRGADLVERETYDQAIQGIPFDRLTDDAQARLWKIVSQPSIYRRLPVTRLQTDQDMYLFLVRHPEVIVNMWELMGVTKVTMRRTGEYTFAANDGAGTTGTAELIYGDRDTHLVVGEGTYEGPILKRKIHGRCLIVLKSAYAPESQYRSQVTHRLDMFVQLDNVGADLLAKTLQPLVGKTADHNFVETSRFVGQISQAAETRPTGMQQLAGRLTRTDPTVRERFASLSAEIYARASGTAPSSTGGLVPVTATAP